MPAVLVEPSVNTTHAADAVMRHRSDAERVAWSLPRHLALRNADNLVFLSLWGQSACMSKGKQVGHTGYPVKAHKQVTLRNYLQGQGGCAQNVCEGHDGDEVFGRPLHCHHRSIGDHPQRAEAHVPVLDLLLDGLPPGACVRGLRHGDHGMQGAVFESAWQVDLVTFQSLKMLPWPVGQMHVYCGLGSR